MEKSKNKRKRLKSLKWREKVDFVVFGSVGLVMLGRMRCAERTQSSLLLWQHEFYMVVEKDPYRGPPKPYLYQAKEFRLGSLMPEEELKGFE